VQLSQAKVAPVASIFSRTAATLCVRRLSSTRSARRGAWDTILDRERPGKHRYRWKLPLSLQPAPRTGQGSQQGETAPTAAEWLPGWLSLLRPSPVAAHLGVEPGFVHKHPPPVFDLPYALLKYWRCCRPARPLVLGHRPTFFKTQSHLLLQHHPAIEATDPQLDSVE